MPSCVAYLFVGNGRESQNARTPSTVKSGVLTPLAQEAERAQEEET